MSNHLVNTIKKQIYDLKNVYIEIPPHLNSYVYGNIYLRNKLI